MKNKILVLESKSNTLMGEEMRITQKGQVTFPEEIRKKYGFLSYTNIDFVEEKGKVYLVVSEKKHRESSIIAHMKGTADVRMTTDQILKLTRN